MITRAKQGQVNIGQTNELFIYTALGNERALKRAVLLRKNILFYKNEHGAAIGDLLLSLIETCRHNGVNAWPYLLTVYSRAEEVRKNPTLYLPWNYREAVEERARAA